MWAAVCALLLLAALPVAATDSVPAVDWRASIDAATRHVRRGADLPTSDQGVTSIGAAARHRTTGVFARARLTAVLTDRDAPFRTRDLDELFAAAGINRTFDLAGRLVAAALAVDGYLYPRRVEAGYGALIIEPRLALAAPQLPLSPSFYLVYDTTPLQRGWYWELSATVVPRVASRPVPVSGSFGWVEHYRKQDTPDIISTTRAVGVLGFLAALAPAVAELEIAAPVAVASVPTGDGRSRRIDFRPYVRAVLVSPFVQSINEDGAELVLGLRLSAATAGAQNSESFRFFLD
jgi:hypothetical protein